MNGDSRPNGEYAPLLGKGDASCFPFVHFLIRSLYFPLSCWLDLLRIVIISPLCD